MLSEKKKKQMDVTTETKVEALKRLDKGASVKKVAIDLNVCRATILGWRRRDQRLSPGV